MIEGVGLASHATSPSAVATAIARSARKTSEAVRRKLAWVRKRFEHRGGVHRGDGRHHGLGSGPHQPRRHVPASEQADATGHRGHHDTANTRRCGVKGHGLHRIVPRQRDDVRTHLLRKGDRAGKGRIAFRSPLHALAARFDHKRRARAAKRLGHTRCRANNSRRRRIGGHQHQNVFAASRMRHRSRRGAREAVGSATQGNFAQRRQIRSREKVRKRRPRSARARRFCPSAGA